MLKRSSAEDSEWKGKLFMSKWKNSMKYGDSSIADPQHCLLIFEGTFTSFSKDKKS
jgi:hypothetical protein